MRTQNNHRILTFAIIQDAILQKIQAYCSILMDKITFGKQITANNQDSFG